MNLKKKARLAILLAGALLIIFAITAAGAQPKAEAIVTISTDQNLYPAQQDVLIHVTFSNPTNHTIRVLKWYTPVDGVEEPLFKVSLDGVPVAYTGPLFKRPAATGKDYITLKSGESFTNDVSLGEYYDLSANGSYTVIYDVSASNLTNEKIAGPDYGVETLTSNPLLLGIEGRPSAAPLDLVSPLAVTGSTTFNKCTTTQQSQLITARSQASTYSTGAKSYLLANTQTARYFTWFGAYDAARYSTVTTHFSAISNAMDTAAVKFDCGCKKQYYAYVYANRPYTIYLCKVFWTAPMTGTDSKAGTLIHEMSHFYVVASTLDYVYGQTGAKSLAITDPAKAIMNADNHEYFAENTPSQN